MKIGYLTILLILLYILVPFPRIASAESVSRQEYAVLQKAYELMAQEQYTDSLQRLEPLLQKKTPSSHAFSYAAFCYASLGQELKALKVLERAVTLYPRNNYFWYNLGIFQMQTEDFQGAVRSYQTILQLSQEIKADIYYSLAFALYRLENYSEALVALSKIINYDEVKQHWLLLKVYCEVAQEEWALAEQTGLKILALAPESANIWTVLGQISVNRERYVRATAYMEIANSFSPDMGKNDNLANLYSFHSAWNELVRYKRAKGDSHCEIAERLTASCQYQKAIDELDKINEQLDIKTTLFKGQILFALGKNEEALVQLLQVEQLSFKSNAQHDKQVLAKKEKRQQRDRLTARAFLLAGQILWLEHRWEESRDVFKKLELLSGYGELGRNLANCMQTLLLEKQVVNDQPGLYDPPLVTEHLTAN